MENLSDKYLNKIIQQKLFDGPGDIPDTLEGLNTNDYTAVVYNAVKGIIQELKESGELKPDENLDAAGITAQILLETGNGKSSLASKYNNFGGIKADKYWKGKTIMIPNSDGNVNWRVYPSVKKGLEEQVRFFLPSKNPRYYKAGVLSAKNAAEHAKRVQEAGYAGNQKDYADRVIEMANSINKRLQKANPDYSKGATYEGFKIEDTVPESTSYQESTGQDFMQQQDLNQPITIGNSNPASVFLNENTRIDLAAPVDISNPSTKILDNSFYNDNRGKEELKQSKKNQKFIDSPVKFKKGGYMRKLSYGGPEDPEDPKDPFSTSKIDKPTNPIDTSKGFFGTLMNMAKYDAARKMSETELPERGDLSYEDYLSTLNRKELSSIPLKEQMLKRDLELENYKTKKVREEIANIGKKLGTGYNQENALGLSVNQQYDYLGVPFMYNQNSWFHNIPNNIYYSPHTCQGIACAIARKAGAVNAADYKTRSASGKKGNPLSIETGTSTVDHPDVMPAKGYYKVDDVQAGDMIRHGQNEGKTYHNTTAIAEGIPSYKKNSVGDEVLSYKYKTAYGSNWPQGVMKGDSYTMEPKYDQSWRYFGNVPLLQKDLSEAESLNTKYQNYLAQKEIAKIPVREIKSIRTGPVKVPYIPKKEYPNTRKGRKQEKQDNAYIEAYMARMQKK
jgi:hypothetical protein